jgi:hypothetical protein
MRGFPITYSDFSGGLNNQSGPYLLQGNQARDCLNVHTSATGDIEKRNGFVTVSGATLTGSPINATGVHTLFPVNTATKSLIGVATTATTDTIFKMTTAGVASSLKTGLTANTRWYWAQGDVATGGTGPIYGLNGVDTPQKWNGSAAATENWVATAGTVPKEAKYLTYFSSRLWCAEGSRVRYSGITGSTPDLSNWEAENYVDLEPTDGQTITGIGIIGSYLLVFKSRKTYVIYDPNTAANRQISNEIGCVAHRSIVQTPLGVFFLSEDQGVCKTDGKGVTPFSDSIKPTTDAVANSPATAKLAAGTMIGRRYYLSVSTLGVKNDHVLEYDMIAGSWWPHDCATNEFALLDPGGTPTLYSADSKATRVSQAFASEVFQDNGSNYAGKSYYITPYYAWGNSGSLRYMRYVDPHKVKRVREVRIDGVGNWEAYVATDFTDEWGLMDGEVWDQSNEGRGLFMEETTGQFEKARTGTFMEANLATVDRHYPTPALGRAVSFRFYNDDSHNFRIYSETVNIQMREN